MSGNIKIVHVISKFVIKYGNNFYITRDWFTLSEKDWFTDNINEIPKDMLFDGYNKALVCLMSIYERHRLVGKRLSIDVVKILEEEEANDEKILGFNISR